MRALAAWISSSAGPSCRGRQHFLRPEQVRAGAVVLVEARDDRLDLGALLAVRRNRFMSRAESALDNCRSISSSRFASCSSLVFIEVFMGSRGVGGRHRSTPAADRRRCVAAGRKSEDAVMRATDAARSTDRNIGR